MASDDCIRFILDGEVIELRDVDPARTVLQYLREDLGRIGTKEGCAEGDCGACTIALGEVERGGDGIRIRAINSCIQFLPTLDGKELITVESLRAEDGTLHPVQQAMVDCHGSQCGFCTPGFVMSLYTLYEENRTPSRREIDDALAGNLCRCTGYSPIIKAAQTMHSYPEGTVDRAAATGRRIERLRSIARRDTLRIEHDGRRFFAPRGIDEFATLVHENPDAVILAGGTDVGLWVTKELREPDTVIHAGEVEELARVAETDTHLEIGAAVTLSDAMPLIHAHYPELDELFMRFASPPIRNAGTIGGNVANGSPIGDTMPALLVLDASLVLRRGDASREVPLDDFYLGYRQNTLEPGEFVERVRIPLFGDHDEIRSYKISKRFDQDISAVCGAYRLRLDGDRVADVRIAYGGMAAVPKRANACEDALRGADWSVESIDLARRALDDDFTPIDDMRASAHYRQEVCRNLLVRFFRETTGADTVRVYDYGR